MQADIKLVNITYTVCFSTFITGLRPMSAFVTHLFSDLDEQEEDNKNEQVVNDADSSDDDVDDLECKVTNVGQMRRQIVRL